MRRRNTTSAAISTLPQAMPTDYLAWADSENNTSAYHNGIFTSSEKGEKHFSPFSLESFALIFYCAGRDWDRRCPALAPDSFRGLF